MDYDIEHIALLAMYHDCTEIITGDMPTPVKYYNTEIKDAYKEIEVNAAKIFFQDFLRIWLWSMKNIFCQKRMHQL